MATPPAEMRKVHDRRASNLPANAMVRVVTVDDPYEAGAKIAAVASLRDDPLGRLRARKQIDEAQYRAGRDMQALYERAEIGKVMAVDTTKEPVDCGGAPEVLTDGQQRAIKEIIRLERVLGLEGSALVRDVLAERMFIEQCAATRGMVRRHEREYLGRRFRECLETLAKELHYA